MNSVIVSFCIPVYNNAEAAAKIVKGLLSLNDSRFEVVVSDDASTDDTQKMLSSIHDSRFRYYRNEKNLGAHKNWEHSLELGKGEWLYLVMGRDRIHSEKIPRLIELLEYSRENGITYLKDGYSNAGREGIRIYSGIDAMIKFIIRVHPTGDIYNGTIFRNIPNRTIYFGISDMYPENHIRHNLLLQGKGAAIMSGVHIGKEEYIIDFAAVKSGVDKNHNVFDTYFAPRRTTIQNLEHMDIMDADSSIFSRKELDRYFRSNFNTTLHCVSILWQGKCADYSWMAHYGHNVRKVGIIEITSNILRAYRETKSYLQEHGTYTPVRERIMKVYTAKWLVYSIFRTGIRRTCEFLGFWKFMRAVKKYAS
ncbi:MAG: glycosyltransferase family 2 protein [Synergistaceae bacterium]|nr:glycosyltransferase family 2 protein [Synergistaceae bacterium]